MLEKIDPLLVKQTLAEVNRVRLHFLNLPPIEELVEGGILCFDCPITNSLVLGLDKDEANKYKTRGSGSVDYGEFSIPSKNTRIVQSDIFKAFIEVNDSLDRRRE